MTRTPLRRRSRPPIRRRLPEHATVLSPGSIEDLGLVPVVGAAAELDVLGGRPAARTVRLDVMELEEPSLPAALAAGSHECAAATVSGRHHSPHLGRHIA